MLACNQSQNEPRNGMYLAKLAHIEEPRAEGLLHPDDRLIRQRGAPGTCDLLRNVVSDHERVGEAVTVVWPSFLLHTPAHLVAASAVALAPHLPSPNKW